MQTKKRARPVKFGKVVKKEEPKVEKEEEKAAKVKTQAEEPAEIKEEKLISKKEVLEDVETDSSEETEHEEVSETEEAASENETEEVSEEESEEKEEQIEEDQVKKASFGSFTKEDEQKGGRKGGFGFFFLVAFLTFLLGLAVISGISYLMPDQKESLKVVNTEDSSNPQPTAEPTTPPEEVDLTAYAIEVLNGSGTTGEAAKVKTQLETAGFKIGTVGNADTSDYTKSVISAKKSVNQQYLNKLMEELKKTYEVNAVVESATASQTSDVVVTVGSSTTE